MTTLLQILAHTPAWVFALFLLLLVLGVRQMRETLVRPARLATLPVAMAALSLYGVVSAFGARVLPLAAWLTGAAFAAALVLWRPLPVRLHYESASRTIRLPGSAAPLAFMMGIFFTKYTVNAATAMQPALGHQASLALAASVLYGSFSGVFVGRALRVGWYFLRGRSCDPREHACS